ncbi:class I peptide chain release factor [Actinidia rufa]|uniref:Class I peptide chain release factor n=1 Tax=Actinidia rufa TaxID=165716 RepID=A0A7J0FR65_9ERIC|nr:class I peptide chain release factor [Actinidia rufa]
MKNQNLTITSTDPESNGGNQSDNEHDSQRNLPSVTVTVAVAILGFCPHVPNIATKLERAHPPQLPENLLRPLSVARRRIPPPVGRRRRRGCLIFSNSWWKRRRELPSAGNEPIPKITLDHVTVNFARSGGPGGQNVNKVNTKVDMRFNIKNAYWLSERVREKIMQMAIIDAASYVPPPPSKEQVKRIAKLAAIGEQKRLKSKKVLSDKKAFRRSRDSWD